MNNKPTEYLSVWVCIGLTVITAAVFCQVYTFEFVDYDDLQYVYRNPNIQAGITLRSIKWAFTTGYASNWHPLTWLSHMLDWELFGDNPAGHHLINLIFHIANTLLLFLVLKQMTNSLWPSAFAAALFALHPFHVESVAWIAERKDVLSTLFWLLTMAAYLRYVKRPSIVSYTLALSSFGLGLMAKPMLITLPFVLLLLDYWPLARVPAEEAVGKTNRRNKKHADRRFYPSTFYHLVREKIPFFVLSAVSIIVTFLVQRSGGAMKVVKTLSLDLRIFNALVSYISYIAKMFYPSRLAVLYPQAVTKLPMWQPLLCLLVLAGVTAATIYAARRRRYLLVGWLWYLGTLVPVIGLVQVGAQSMADRYTYLPSIGIFIMVAWGAAELFISLNLRKIVPTVSATIILAALIICSRMQLRYWQDSLTLFSHAVEVTRDNYIMHSNYGKVLNDKGRFNEAIEHFKQSLRINPKYVRAHVNLGIMYYYEGNVKQAIVHWNTALSLEPNNVGALNHLAWLRATQKKPEFRNPDQAVYLARRACGLTNYREPNLLDTLAAAYAAAGNFNKAIKTAERALELCQFPTQEALKEEIKGRLGLYKAGKPYIETQ